LATWRIYQADDGLNADRKQAAKDVADLLFVLRKHFPAFREAVPEAADELRMIDDVVDRVRAKALAAAKDVWVGDLVGPTGIVHSVAGLSEADVSAKAQAYNDWAARRGLTVGVVPQASIAP
jgi:hypothetical protein